MCKQRRKGDVHLLHSFSLLTKAASVKFPFGLPLAILTVKDLEQIQVSNHVAY